MVAWFDRLFDAWEVDVTKEMKELRGVSMFHETRARVGPPALANVSDQSCAMKLTHCHGGLLPGSCPRKAALIKGGNRESSCDISHLSRPGVRRIGSKAMNKCCATAILLAWVLWEYTMAFSHGTKSETWRHVDAHYFNWTCKLASYWEASSLAKGPRRRYLGWNSVEIEWRNKPSEIHEFICFPDDVDPQKLRLWR